MSWKLCHPNVNMQQNGYDCGVFMCQFARSLCLRQMLEVVPQHIGKQGTTTGTVLRQTGFPFSQVLLRLLHCRLCRCSRFPPPADARAARRWT